MRTTVVLQPTTDSMRWRMCLKAKLQNLRSSNFMTPDEFKREACSLASASCTIDDYEPWEWCSGVEDFTSSCGYLRQRFVRCYDLSTNDSSDSEDEKKLTCCMLEEDAEEDSSALSGIHDCNSSSSVTSEVHIAYSVIYSEPMLLFNKFYASGSLLSHGDLWRTILPGHLPTKIRCNITQQEHPVLGTPFYAVHPCQTAAFMHDAMSMEGRIRSGLYLASWLSTMGCVVDNQPPVALYRKIMGMSDFSENN